MNKADVTHAQVIVSNGNTVLLGTVKYIDETLNFKTTYNWSTLDEDGFIEDLREKIAQDLDIIPSKVDVKRDHLLRKMREGTFEALLRGYIK